MFGSYKVLCFFLLIAVVAARRGGRGRGRKGPKGIIAMLGSSAEIKECAEAVFKKPEDGPTKEDFEAVMESCIDETTDLAALRDRLFDRAQAKDKDIKFLNIKVAKKASKKMTKFPEVNSVMCCALAQSGKNVLNEDKDALDTIKVRDLLLEMHSDNTRIKNAITLEVATECAEEVKGCMFMGVKKCFIEKCAENLEGVEEDDDEEVLDEDVEDL